MNSAPSHHKPETLLPRAVSGDASAREDLLSFYRPYLRCAAERGLPRVIQRRVDPSDVVQQTLIDIVRGLPEFCGQSEKEFTAWVVKILERNFLQNLRSNTLAKRDVRLEQDWGGEQGSAEREWRLPASADPSPSNVLLRGEMVQQLSTALDGLPNDQRTAVSMRYIAHMSLSEIAGAMNRSLGSVAGLIRRGVAALETLLPEEFRDHF